MFYVPKYAIKKQQHLQFFPSFLCSSFGQNPKHSLSLDSVKCTDTAQKGQEVPNHLFAPLLLILNGSICEESFSGVLHFRLSSLGIPSICKLLLLFNSSGSCSYYGLFKTYFPINLILKGERARREREMNSSAVGGKSVSNHYC